MAILNLTSYKPVSGTTGDANQISNGFTAIETVVNALTNANIDAAAAIAASKLAGYPADSTKTLLGDGTWGTPATIPSGTIITSAAVSVPTGYLACDASSQLRVTYAALFAALSATKGTFTVTLASPGVFTLNAHGFVAGDAVTFSTTGALPTGLTAGITYYVISAGLTANTFEVSATLGGAAVNTSGAQSGTHTAVWVPFGVADATHFNLPDAQGRSLVAKGTHADVAALGANDGVSLANRRPKHQHPNIYDPGHFHQDYYNTSGASSSWPKPADFGSVQSGSNPTSTNTTGIKVNPEGASSSSSPVDAPAYLVVNTYIKT